MRKGGRGNETVGDTRMLASQRIVFSRDEQSTGFLSFFRRMVDSFGSGGGARRAKDFSIGGLDQAEGEATWNGDDWRRNGSTVDSKRDYRGGMVPRSRASKMNNSDEEAAEDG
ncbi:unnamed protein product [Caenorhabditis brenneri]